jgi:hypothetical protein
MNGQTLLGTSQDPRIQQCGIRIAGGRLADFEPFIQAAAGFNGRFDLSVIKVSASGTSQSRQGSAIKSGRLGSSHIGIDLPARVTVDLRVTDERGKAVCGLSQTIDLPVETTAL